MDERHQEDGLDTEGIRVVINVLADDFSADLQAAQAVQTETEATAQRIKAVEERLLRLGIAPPPRCRASVTKDSPPAHKSSPKPEAVRLQWDDLRRDAERRLRDRGVNPDEVSLDAVLDPEEVKRIERRFRGGFHLQANLDQYDTMTAIFAGLVACLVDFVLVRTPADSPLTSFMRHHSIPQDNWLSPYVKTSFDKVKEVADKIPGFYPGSHRLQTFGHDPLIGLVVGTIDIIRGGLTAIGKDGELVFLSDTGPAGHPLAAVFVEIGHLLSDAFTKAGLPAPGWSLLQLVKAGSFGQKERTVAELARFMYLKGYDTRHFLTMSTSVAAAEAVLRTYIGIRRYCDSPFDNEFSHQGDVAGAEKLGEHPRFQAMALIAHTIGAAANGGKIAVYGGNPLALNYAQWLRFVYALLKWWNTKLRAPSSVLRGYAYANMKELQEGWPAINVNDPEFPTLVIT